MLKLNSLDFHLSSFLILQNVESFNIKINKIFSYLYSSFILLYLEAIFEFAYCINKAVLINKITVVSKCSVGDLVNSPITPTVSQM